MARDADTAQPRAEKDDVDNAEEARIGAFPGEEETRIPEPATEVEAGTAGESVSPETPPEPVLWQGELDFAPAELPREPEYPDCVSGAKAGGEDEATSPAGENDPADSNRKEASGAKETLPVTKAGQGAAATAVKCNTGGWY